ncbi:UDP-2,3-diacylglucosamine hydrolase [Marinomonas aquimarina]|uniref:UDP-2,3-diacylglucosamine hydrolase n=1 Tax=Marinomonas aquimarina TaxID=295068 RepID=A0A1A8TE54_9GAMM|nr:UDP-2,3-diacylglucosamine diphosphatase [Marinomonas aquimarina]SBS31516.1 UDP-2,3-diacylglucosamine hydrolase [Marinomonas aquimarina]
MLRYFISDLHLSDKRLDLIQAFVHLTDEICQNTGETELYILGDFFEAYIGDDYQPNWMITLDQQFAKLHQHQVTTYFIAGNRDFLVGKDWFQRNQVIELNEQHPLAQNGHTVILTHGDEFCIDDQAYQGFRAMVRQPEWQQQVLSMPLEQRLALAQKLRDDSKSMSADKSMAIMDVNIGTINESLSSETDLLIHGHTHRPALHSDENITRLVLGDWDQWLWCGVLEGNHFSQYQISAQAYLEKAIKIEEWQKMHSLTLN